MPNIPPPTLATSTAIDSALLARQRRRRAESDARHAEQRLNAMNASERAAYIEAQQRASTSVFPPAAAEVGAQVHRDVSAALNAASNAQSILRPSTVRGHRMFFSTVDPHAEATLDSVGPAEPATPSAPTPTAQPAQPPPRARSRDRSNVPWRQVQAHWWKPDARLLGVRGSRNVRRAGIELEVAMSRDSNINRICTEAFEFMDAHWPDVENRGEFFHAERDGSIHPTGLEFVTAAFAVDAYHCDEAKLALKALDHLVDFLGDYASPRDCQASCGMHVHVTRRCKWMPADLIESNPAVLRRQACMQAVLPTLLAGQNIGNAGFDNTARNAQVLCRKRWISLTGRPAGSDLSYCRIEYSDARAVADRIRSGPSGDASFRGASFCGGERYSAINWNNEHTYEFRAPGSVWDAPAPVRFHRAQIELALLIDDYPFYLASDASLRFHSNLDREANAALHYLSGMAPPPEWSDNALPLTLKPNFPRRVWRAMLYYAIRNAPHYDHLLTWVDYLATGPNHLNNGMSPFSLSRLTSEAFRTEFPSLSNFSSPGDHA